MTRFALTLEYDGRPFVGWQRQTLGASVQQTLEDAVFAITSERTTVYAAGRTDAGVHALAMRAHVDIGRPIAPFRLMEAINALVRPAPVAVTACEVVADDWHARFSCVQRHYRYRIVNRRAPLTWQQGLVWRVKQPLDTAAMQAGAERLRGQHDFTTFRSTHCQAESPVRTLERLDVAREDDTIEVAVSGGSMRRRMGCGSWGRIMLTPLPAYRERDRRAAGPARVRE